MEIEEVTTEDAGLYRITLENEYGRIEATARLDIISNKRSSGHGIRTSASPRRSISSSRRIMGNSTRIGGRLALACNFRGGSVPNKKFYHNGTEMPPTDRIRVIENEETSCLVIDNVQAEDEGVYTCIANNESGIAATSTIVTFNDAQEHNAPEIIRGLGKSVQAKEGYVLDLVCSVVCSDPFEMVWSRNGDVLHDSDDFRYNIAQFIIENSQNYFQFYEQLHRPWRRFDFTEDIRSICIRFGQIHVHRSFRLW